MCSAGSNREPGYSGSLRRGGVACGTESPDVDSSWCGFNNSTITAWRTQVQSLCSAILCVWFLTSCLMLTRRLQYLRSLSPHPRQCLSSHFTKWAKGSHTLSSQQTSVSLAENEYNTRTLRASFLSALQEPNHLHNWFSHHVLCYFFHCSIEKQQFKSLLSVAIPILGAGNCCLCACYCMNYIHQHEISVT